MGIGANHLGMAARRRRFVTFLEQLSALLVVVGACPIILHYRTSLRFIDPNGLRLFYLDLRSSYVAL
jgi:hypothetical protein